MATTAERIKEAMELRGLKQAEIIRMTGISKGALSSYLSGRYAPKQNNIYKLSQILGVNEAWLLGKDVPIDPRPVNIEHQYSSSPVSVLRSDETVLLSDYNLLNAIGKEVALQYVHDMTEISRYKKELGTLEAEEAEASMMAAHGREDLPSTVEERREEGIAVLDQARKLSGISDT